MSNCHTCMVGATVVTAGVSNVCYSVLDIMGIADMSGKIGMLTNIATRES